MKMKMNPTATPPYTPSRPWLSCYTCRTQYEMYFVAPASVSGPYTISITAQLGTGAVASNWKVGSLTYRLHV